MTSIAITDLLEAGVHFGHQTKRWNPKMKPYIFGARNGIYIIDLGKTAQLFDEAEAFVRDLAANGSNECEAADTCGNHLCIALYDCGLCFRQIG